MDVKFVKTHNYASVFAGCCFLVNKSFIDLSGIELSENTLIEVTAVDDEKVTFHKIPVHPGLLPLKLRMMKDLFLRSLDVGVIDSVKIEEET